MEELRDIVHHLEPELGSAEAEPVPLQGGITNRNYRVRFGGIDYVLRLHGKDTELLGINRQAERIAHETAAGLGIAPAFAAAFRGGMVTRYVRCETLTEVEVAARAEELAAALRRFHETGVRLPSPFRVPDLIGAYERILRARGETPPPELRAAGELAERIAAALPARERRPCHNDLLPGNVIADEDGGGVMIVDWEYAGMGDPWFDLGNLSVNNDFDEADDERLLRAYNHRASSPGERARLKLMRLMSDLREAAWGVVQGSLSDLDFDFAGYADRHFARLRGATGGGELERLLAAAGE